MKKQYFFKALVCSMALYTAFSLCGCDNSTSKESSAQSQLSTVTNSSEPTENSSDHSLSEIVDSGVCGKNGDDVTWELDKNDQLVISGSGEIRDYDFIDNEEMQDHDISPWHKYNIKTVIVKDGVTSIGKEAFADCTSLTSITIPDSVTSIGTEAFECCTSLTSITIPDSVTSIGWGAFYDCTSLTSITIPDSVTSIGGSAFYNTKWYESQPDGLVYAGKVVCAYKGDMPEETNITIPDSVTSIGEKAFEYCENLTSITIPDSVTSIGDGAFYHCSNLTSITIADSVTSIGKEAFEYCTSLTSITIPDGVTSIGRGVFYGCASLASITIPDSVTSIREEAFSNTAWYDSQPDGVVYAGKVAYSYKGKMPADTNLELKEGTKGIADCAFSDCTSLTSITIPDSVTSIGNRAFSNTAWYDSQPDGVVYAGKVAYSYTESTPADTNLVLKEGTKGIADYAFYYCTSLTGITIPDSVTSIGWDAFGYCTSLTSITIPDSVTGIVEGAFDGWTSSQTIYIKGKSEAPSGWDSDWEKGCEAKIVWNA